MKSIVAVAGGNSIAQVIVLLFAPLITRIYSPEVFGLQGVFLAAVSLLSPVVALRFPMAIVLARGENEIRQIESLSVATALAVTSVLAIALGLFPGHLARLFGLEDIGALIYMLPVALLMIGFQEVADYKAARVGRFRALSIVTSVQSLVVNAARVAVGVFAPVGATLIALSTLGPALHAGMLTLFQPKEALEPSSADRRRLDRNPLRLWRLAKRLRSFPLMRTPTDLLNAASQTAPVLLLAVLFTPAVAGLYTLARSVLNVPSNVIGNAIGKVFYAHFAELAREKKPVGGLAVKATLVLFGGPGLLVIVVSLFAPSLFAFVFGEAWREAGVYAQWMALWIAVALATVPSVRLAPVIDRQGLLLGANVIMLLLRAGSIPVSLQFSVLAVDAVRAYSIVSAVSNLGLIVCLLGAAHLRDRRLSA